MLIVDPEMGLWPKDAPDKMEEVVLTFEGARCVKINGKKVSPQEAIREANAIGGRNGIGISHALENRIIGTKSRGVYEAPGMELLGSALKYVYQAVLDRRATKLFEHLSGLVSDQVQAVAAHAHPPPTRHPPTAHPPPTRHPVATPAVSRRGSGCPPCLGVPWGALGCLGVRASATADPVFNGTGARVCTDLRRPLLRPGNDGLAHRHPGAH